MFWQNENKMDKIIHKELFCFFKRHPVFIVLLVASFLRFRDICYMEAHPDTYFLSENIRHMLSTGDINPHWFCWPGSFIFYILGLLYAGVLLILLTYNYLGGESFGLYVFKQMVYTQTPLLYFSGHVLMATFSIVTIYFTYLLSKKLFNKHVALLAAFSLSIFPLHVVHSRFIRPDGPTTMLVMASLLLLVLFNEKKKNLKLFFVSCLLAGLSIATKYTSGVIFFTIIIYSLILDAKETNLFSVKYFYQSIRAKTFFIKGILFVLIGFFIGAPFVVLDWQQASKDMLDPVARVLTDRARFPGIQNDVWYFKKVFIKGIGNLFFTVFSCIGILSVLFQNNFKKYLFFSFFLFYYMAIVSFGPMRWERWLIPLLPFIAIFFGVGFYGFYKYFEQNFVFVFQRKKIIRFLLLFILVLCSVPVIRFDWNALNKSNTHNLSGYWNQPGAIEI